MLVTLVCLAALVVVAWPLACGVPLPVIARRTGEEERRIRLVTREPQHATSADIERLMRAHELPEAEVRLVSDRARQLGIRPFTMWVWIQQYGVHALAIVVAADLAHEELLGHLGSGTLPDLEELRVLAALNGLHTAGPSAAGPAPRRTVPAAPPSATPGRAEANGLVVHDPGSWPFAGWQPGEELFVELEDTLLDDPFDTPHDLPDHRAA